MKPVHVLAVVGLTVGLLAGVQPSQAVQAPVAEAASAHDLADLRVAAGRMDTLRTPITGSRKALPSTQKVVFVGNNWDGTISVLDPRTLQTLKVLNAVPDDGDRRAEIASDPMHLVFFLAIQQLIGEGHDQLVDDMYSSPDGSMVIVSRPSFADVVALSLDDGHIVWRFPVDGYRSDHMALAPNGKYVVVSASTGNVVHKIDVVTGKSLGKFASGDSPHESVFLDGGRKILHASIGMVYSPIDQPALDATKQGRIFEIVDSKTLKILRMINVRKALDAAGYPDASTAVRPMTVSPDEKFVYFQVSFFHGFFEMNLRTEKITRVATLPNLIPNMPKEQYLLDSAHHGIAINPQGNKICVAGTMDDYATVVDRKTLKPGKLLTTGTKPYWVTQSANGRYCYISWSGSDLVSKISYRTGRVVQSGKVGDHPQRVRNGYIISSYLD